MVLVHLFLSSFKLFQLETSVQSSEEAREVSELRALLEEAAVADDAAEEVDVVEVEAAGLGVVPSPGASRTLTPSKFRTSVDRATQTVIK